MAQFIKHKARDLIISLVIASAIFSVAFGGYSIGKQSYQAPPGTQSAEILK